MTDLELKKYMDQGIQEKEAKEIEKRVYMEFPRTKKEKECKTEKANRDELRELRRKRYINQTKEKREIKVGLEVTGESYGYKIYRPIDGQK